MKYEEFRAKVEEYPFFGEWIFDLIAPDSSGFKNRITDWIERGLLIRLKRGFYTLRDKDRTHKFSSAFLANNLYSPSYVSLEYAMQYYDLIPERVYLVTSVTTKKTNEFMNQEGRFAYAHVKQDVFSDFTALKDSYGNTFLIASPEKALLDFMYLRMKRIKNIKANIFEESYRLQNLDQIDCDKLRRISKKYKQKKLSLLTEMLIEYIKQEWQ